MGHYQLLKGWWGKQKGWWRNFPALCMVQNASVQAVMPVLMLLEGRKPDGDDHRSVFTARFQPATGSVSDGNSRRGRYRSSYQPARHGGTKVQGEVTALQSLIVCCFFCLFGRINDRVVEGYPWSFRTYNNTIYRIIIALWNSVWKYAVNLNLTQSRMCRLNFDGHIHFCGNYHN